MFCTKSWKSISVLHLNASHFKWATLQVVSSYRYTVLDNVALKDTWLAHIGAATLTRSKGDCSRKKLGRAIPSPKLLLRLLGEGGAMASLSGKDVHWGVASLGWEARKPSACMLKILKGSLLCDVRKTCWKAALRDVNETCKRVSATGPATHRRLGRGP